MRYFYVVGITKVGFIAAIVESSGELVINEAIKVLTKSKTTNNAVITWFQEVSQACFAANQNALFPPVESEEDELP
jgi:hypothetical protein